VFEALGVQQGIAEEGVKWEGAHASRFVPSSLFLGSFIYFFGFF
jgi:hypothetical protein